MSRSEATRAGGSPPAEDGDARPGGGSRAPLGPAGVRPQRYGRYFALRGALIVVSTTINTVLTNPNGARGVEPGRRIPPFAVPLAIGTVRGDADVATHADAGSAGRTPACSERGVGILNICALYEAGPVVLALFVDASSCPQVLDDMQALAPQFPGVGLAAVAIKGDRSSLRRLIAKRALTSVQVGFDKDGVLAGLYKLVSCPQVNLVLPGGLVQSHALLSRPSRATLRARVRALVDAATGRGWRAPRR
jgi:hypothetical protein